MVQDLPSDGVAWTKSARRGARGVGQVPAGVERVDAGVGSAGLDSASGGCTLASGGYVPASDRRGPDSAKNDDRGAVLVRINDCERISR